MNEILKLVEIMKKLRDPKDGCPWDSKQDFKSIARYCLEEAYEVVDAIEREDYNDLRDELGDLLLQVIFHSQMASEKGLFDFKDVTRSINEKMIRRHPHVFSEKKGRDVNEIKKSWDEIKRAEKATQMKGEGASFFEDVEIGFPAVMRAVKLQKKASEVGFDWDDYVPALQKTQEEIEELTYELQDSSNSKYKSTDEIEGNRARIKDEIGDVLFAVINLARLLKIDPEAALRGTNNKFVKRFDKVHQKILDDGLTLEEASLEQMEEKWVEVKKAEKDTKNY